MSRIATVQPGQNLADIAIQYCGNEQSVFEVARLNNLSITDDLQAGSQLILPVVEDERVRRFYVEGGYEPATGVTEKLEGIGYWAIGVDFVVS